MPSTAMVDSASPAAQAPALLAAVAAGRLDADAWATQLATPGRLVLRTVGMLPARLGPWDDEQAGKAGAPIEPATLLQACAALPVTLGPGGPAAHTALPPTALDKHGQGCLAAVLAAPAQPLLIATHDSSGAMLFAVLRELLRTGELAPRPLHALDLVSAQTPAQRAYNQARLQTLVGWVQELGGSSPNATALQAARAVRAQQQTLLQQLARLRQRAPTQVPAPLALALRDAAAVLPPTLHAALLSHFLAQSHAANAAASQEGADCIRVYLSGTPGLAEAARPVFAALERQGCALVADDAHGGAIEADGADESADTGANDSAKASVRAAVAAGADVLLHLYRRGDDAAAWQTPLLRAACAGSGLLFRASHVDEDQGIDWPAIWHAQNNMPARPEPAPPVAAQAVGRYSAAEGASRRPQKSQTPQTQTSPAPASTRAGERSHKALQSAAGFSAYQRDWFKTLRHAAASGEPLAIVNADAPQELLRSFGIPFVVNQWWASLVAAKQQSARHLALLRAHGYPDAAEPYSAQGLAAALEDEPGAAPWGGLPTPQLLLAFTSSPATRGLFTAWSQRTGAAALLFDRSIESRLSPPLAWWQLLHTHWDEALEPCRLDLLEHQFEDATVRIETLTGRSFSLQRLREVMDLVNEQESWYARTRELIAAAPRAPVCIADTMPATMVPQWHRGTAWGRDAARALFEEVQARVQAGVAVCADERLRLMWVGRGLWSDMGFYQRWHASHGAVFVWSMYLALAADGYIRHIGPGQRPLRALASRFLTMGDELRMPTWAGAWHVHEARRHRVHAAIAVDDADPQVLGALERAGIPVLHLSIDNFSAGTACIDAAAQRMDGFLDALVSTPAAVRESTSWESS